MSNRFHSKFHRQNHHTYSNPLNPDAGHDPIASREQPFQGDLVLNGALSCYAPTSAVAGYFFSNNISLCAIAGNRGAHIFSRGDTGIYVYSAGTAISAYGVTQGANIYSTGIGMDIFGTNTSIKANSPYYGITSFGGTYAGSFLSTTRAITAFGTGFGLDVKSNNYGVNSYGGTFGGNFYSPSRGLSAYGGSVGVDIYSPQIGLNIKALNSGLITNSPVLALSSAGGGINVFDGSVGIGTRSPNEKLTLSGNLSAKGVVFIDSNDNTSPALTISQAGNGYCIRVNDQSGTDISPFAITKDGHALFGSLLAKDALTNLGAGSLGSNITISPYMITLSAQDSDSGLFIKSISGVPFYVEDAHEDSSPFIINNDGNVGIGTKTPNEKLTVVGNISSDGKFFGKGFSSQQGIPNNNDSSTNGYSFGSDGDTGLFSPVIGGGSSNGTVAIFCNNLLALSSTSNTTYFNTNVGIGNLNPNEKLTVFGNISASSSLNCSNLYVRNITGSDSSIEVGGTGNVYIDLKNPNSDDFDLRLETNGTSGGINTATSFHLGLQHNLNTGNVGIGTITPNEKLTISGSISSTGGFSTSRPLSSTGTYTVNSTDCSIILTAATTVTLPTPSQSLGRHLYFKNISTGAINSASTNVVNLLGAATNSILTAGPGKWAHLHSDGVYWQIMAGN